MDALRPPGVPGYLPPPPPMAVPAPYAPPPAAAIAPPAPGAWQPTAAWPYAFPPPPPRPQHDGGWDMLGGLLTTACVTPVAALVGAGIGWAIAGPVGAAKGAMIGGTAPGVLVAALEAVVHPIRRQPYHWMNSAMPLAGASIAGVLGGLGWLVAGATGSLVAVGGVAVLATAYIALNGGLGLVGEYFGFIGSFFR